MEYFNLVTLGVLMVVFIAVVRKFKATHKESTAKHLFEFQETETKENETQSREIHQLDQEIKFYKKNLREKLSLMERLRYAEDEETVEIDAMKDELEKEERSLKIYQQLVIHLRKTTTEAEEKIQRMRSELCLYLERSNKIQEPRISIQCTDSKISCLSKPSELKADNESMKKIRQTDAEKKPWKNSVRLNRNADTESFKINRQTSNTEKKPWNSSVRIDRNRR